MTMPIGHPIMALQKARHLQIFLQTCNSRLHLAGFLVTPEYPEDVPLLLSIVQNCMETVARSRNMIWRFLSVQK